VGILSEKARALAVAIPILKPVNEPGPRKTAMALNFCGEILFSLSNFSILLNNFSENFSLGPNVRNLDLFSSTKPILASSFAVSI